MLHDALITGSKRQSSCNDRRRSARTEVQAELVIMWHHDPDTPVRYPALDLSDGGARIQSATPLTEGMSGTAVKLLPTGQVINRMCTVSWSRRPETSGPFEIGLHFS
jgi:c-di-GMP-binding flagellar brake protein YcgR